MVPASKFPPGSQNNNCLIAPMSITQTPLYVNFNQSKSMQVSYFTFNVYSDSKCQTKVSDFAFNTESKGDANDSLQAGKCNAIPGSKDSWVMPSVLYLSNEDISKMMGLGAKSSTKTIDVIRTLPPMTASATATFTVTSTGASATSSPTSTRRDSNNGQGAVMSSLLGLGALFAWL